MARYPHHASAIGCEVDGRDRVPLRGYVIGAPWTVDTVHRADVSESTAPTKGCRVAPGQPRRGQPTVSCAPFALRSLQFLEFNLRSMPAQNNFFLVLFSSVLAPVALSISTHSPVSIKIQN